MSYKKIIVVFFALSVLFFYAAADCFAGNDLSAYIYKDFSFLLKININSLLNSPQFDDSKIPALKKSQDEIQAEIEKRTGMNFKRDIGDLIICAGPSFNFSRKRLDDFLFILTGKFDAEKLINELKKEKKAKFDFFLKNGRYYISPVKDFQGLFLNENIFIFGPSAVIDSVDNNKFSGGGLNESIKSFFETSVFFMNFSPSFRLKDDILKNSAGVPPIATILLKSLRNLSMFDKYPSLLLRAEFNEKNAAEDLKKFIGSVKDMAGVMISAKEKEEDMKISKAGVVELLSPEIIGAKIALGAGKMLLSSINVSVDNFVCEIDLKVPAEFQAMIKAEHIPMIAGAAGIISAIAVPNFNRSRDRARLKSCTANMKTITGGCELYYMEKGESDSLSVELLVKEGFIKHIPLCPFMKNGCEYKIINGKNGFDVQCPHHGRLSEL